MSTAVSLEKVEKKPQPAAIPSPSVPPVIEPAPAAVEERPLWRDHVALLVWVAGALILILYHFYDLLLSLFS